MHDIADWTQKSQVIPSLSDLAQDERLEAIHSIGLDALLAALPEHSILEIETWLANRHRSSVPAVQVDPACAIPEDLSIPLTHRGRDRAAVVRTAVLQIVATAPSREREQALENYLRDEFSDAERQTVADRELTNE